MMKARHGLRIIYNPYCILSASTCTWYRIYKYLVLSLKIEPDNAGKAHNGLNWVRGATGQWESSFAIN